MNNVFRFPNNANTGREQRASVPSHARQAARSESSPYLEKHSMFGRASSPSEPSSLSRGCERKVRPALIGGVGRFAHGAIGGSVWLACLMLYTVSAAAQSVPVERLHLDGWRAAGYSGEIPAPATIVNVRDYGAPGDGSACDSAVQNAVNALGGGAGVVFFPAGTYLLQNNLSLPSGVVFRGERSSNTLIQVSSDGDCIRVAGGRSGDYQNVTSGFSNQSTVIQVADGSVFAAGDFAEIKQSNDPAYTWSDWATDAVGQIVRIAAVNGNVLTLETGLRLEYGASLTPRIIKVLPVTNVGFENIGFERLNPGGYISNYDNKMTITFENAANCWVRGCEFYNGFGGHVCSYVSTRLDVTGNYIHHAWDYGGGGRGYGVRLESKTGEFLVENNIFHNLRHSILFQVGANGNVVAYNYSFANEGGLSDITMHGNFPYANLIEGNSCQFVHLDNSHYSNGPRNTFLRNKANSAYFSFYSFYVNESKSHLQAFVGNEGKAYSLSATGHIWYANNMNGTVAPSGLTNLSDITYYMGTDYQSTALPSWWCITNPLPSIGLPHGYTTKTIPASYRYANGKSRTVGPPSLWAQPAGVAATQGQAVAFSVSATGTPVAVFQWRKGGTNLPGMTDSSLVIASAQSADAGSYSCAISDEYGSVVSASASLTVQGDTNAVAANWIAYNDCAWHQDPVVDGTGLGLGIEPTPVGYTTNSPWGRRTGNLVTPSGDVLGAGMVFTGPVPGMLARNFALESGSAAEMYFAGHIGTNNSMSWGQGTVNMALTGLNPAKQYEVVIWATRGSRTQAYSNRYTDIVISGADSFANSSSSEVELFGAGNNGSRMRAGNISEVARYTTVRPGADGQVAFALTSGCDLLYPASPTYTNGYLNAVMVSETDPAGGDADSDGMDDGWEIAYFGGTSASNGGAAEDYDGDGVSNLHEYILGTTPVVATPKPKLDASLAGADGLLLGFSVTTAVDRVYIVDYKTSMADTVWQALPGVPGDGAPMSILASNGMDRARCYRLRVGFAP